MSTTRLLVLGAVKLAQPVHGYDVRRELLTWGVADWANVQPGSIYHHLRTLERDRMLEVVAVDRVGARPARTSYRLTDDGDTAFGVLLREAFWKVTGRPADLMRRCPSCRISAGTKPSRPWRAGSTRSTTPSGAWSSGRPRSTSPITSARCSG
ncbi:PadR family transcriptional regulator [Flindersiella endophytica]